MLRDISQTIQIASSIRTVYSEQREDCARSAVTAAQTTRNVERLKILVISEKVDFLHQISCVFSPEFILQYKAKIKISSSLSQAIHEVESDHYDLIFMEDDLNRIGGIEFIAFSRTDESLSNRARIISVKKHIDISKEISSAITYLSR